MMKPLKYEWRNLYYLLMVSFPLILADQLTKLWALTLKGSDPVVLFESWWRFIYVENRGALWGIGNDFPVFYRKLIFLGISSVITLFIVYLLVTYSENRLMKVIYGFVLGGAIGNLIDRFFRGFVVDFVDWHAGDLYHWPTFNIADAAIVVAVFLLAIEVFFNHKRSSSEVKK